MNKRKNNLISKPWAEISAEWKETVTPPMSPSPDDLKIYKKWIDKKKIKGKEMNVLVLGSTMEIRKLLKKYSNFNVVVCDINKSHYLAMSELMGSANKKESFTEAEWSVVPLEKESLDIIIGDGIIANVEHKNKDRFMRNMTRALKHDGIMIIRELCIREGSLMDIDKVLGLFAGYKIDKWSPMELLIALEFAAYDKKNKKISLSEIIKYLNNNYYDKKTKRFLYPSNKKVEKLLNHSAIQKWLAIDKEWDVFDYSETRELIEKHFRIMAREHGRDHRMHPVCKIFGDIMPIWVLARKN